MSNNIYISYAWKDSDEEIDGSREDLVNKLCDAFKTKGIDIIRDKTNLNYNDSIREFMQDIGNSSALIAIISEKYLKSDYCMYELTYAWDKEDFNNRIIPLVLPEANEIYKMDYQLKIVEYWKNQYNQMDKKLDGLDKISAEGFLQKLRDIRFISERASVPIAYLVGMKGIPAELFKQCCYDEIVDFVQQRLFEICKSQSIYKDHKIEVGKSNSEDFKSNHLMQDEMRIFIAKLPITDKYLYGREHELEIFNKAWENSRTNILCVKAFGGVGKSALINTWLHTKMASIVKDGKVRVYGWSFFSQGVNKETTAEEFLNDALKWFGDPDFLEKNPTPWEKGRRLAELVRKEKSLLILDGLEPMQYPPGSLGGELKDQGLKGLIKDLAYYNPGLCIISTRFHVAELSSQPKPAVYSFDLDQLSNKAGAELLQSLGVRGSGEELEVASENYNGHALALNLLGTYLRTVFNGDIHKKYMVRSLFEEEEKGGHAKRVMYSYEIWLNDKPVELEILYLMGLFERPVSGNEISSLREGNPIKDLTHNLCRCGQLQWLYAVSHLRNLKLLFPLDQENPDALDCHPLVREYFGKKLSTEKPAEWKIAHARLFEYYTQKAKEFPSTLEEMEPLFRAARHGCYAGLTKTVFEKLYLRQMCRWENKKRYYLRDEIGSASFDLSVLSRFFCDDKWSEILTENVEQEEILSQEQMAFIFSNMGLLLGLIGRRKEAEKPLLIGYHIYKDEALMGAASDASRHISRYYLTEANFKKSKEYAQIAIELLDKKLPHLRIRAYSTLAESMHMNGCFLESRRLFHVAENARKEENECKFYLHRLHGFRQFELFISLGAFETVINRAEQTVTWKEQTEFKVGRGLHYTALSRALILSSLIDNSIKNSRIKDYLENAINDLRDGQQMRHLPSGLLACAAYYIITKEFDKAQSYLTETKELSEQYEMELHYVDYLIEKSRWFLSQNKINEAQSVYNEAKNRVYTIGYFRRLVDLKRIDFCLKNTEVEFSDVMVKYIYSGVTEWDIQIMSEKDIDDKMIDLVNSYNSPIGNKREIALAMEKIVTLQYDMLATQYMNIRGSEASEPDKKFLNELLQIARESSFTELVDEKIILLLDTGTAYGRDLEYLQAFKDVEALGVERSNGFIKILRQKEASGKLPIGSFVQADVKDLSCFPDNSFNVVRHNASLVHMPIIEKGFSVDLALQESNRILKSGGVLFLSVRSGSGFKLDMKYNNIGSFPYQHYSETDLKGVLVRNGFEITNCCLQPSQSRPDITWLVVIARKI